MGLLPSWGATDALALQRCVGSSCKRHCSLSLICQLGIGQSLIAVTELCLYAIYGTRCVSYLWQSTHWGHWCKCTYIVGTRLDYCYALLAGTADTVIKRLQSVQKTAARLVSGTIFWDHYHYFTQPHWLLVWRRIVSKSTILSLHIWTLHMTG